MHKTVLRPKLRLTHILIILIILVFIYEYYVSLRGTEALRQFFNNYGFSLKAVLEGKYWTFITSMFVHADVQHIVLNLIALFFFGAVVEEALGWKKFLLIFIVSGLVGDLAILATSSLGLMSPNIPTVGASAAIFGLLGTAMLVKPLEFVFYPYIIPVPLILVAFLYAIFNITALIYVITTGTETEISFVSHIGGLLAGMLFGFKEEGRKKSILVIAFLIILLLLTPFIIILFKYLELANYVNIIFSVFK